MIPFENDSLLERILNPESPQEIREISKNFRLNERKNFIQFLKYIKENHPIISADDNQEIRAAIKLRIPPLKNLHEFKTLYEKAFSL